MIAKAAFDGAVRVIRTSDEAHLQTKPILPHEPSVYGRKSEQSILESELSAHFAGNTESAVKATSSLAGPKKRPIDLTPYKDARRFIDLTDEFNTSWGICGTAQNPVLDP